MLVFGSGVRRGVGGRCAKGFELKFWWCVMRLVTSYNGVLQELSRVGGGEECGGVGGVGVRVERRFRTGVEGWDLAAPGGGFVRGAVHELLEVGGGGGGGGAWVLAAVLARAACGGVGGGGGGKVVWADPAGELFAPAVVAAGVPLEKLVILRAGGTGGAGKGRGGAGGVGDQLWGIAECLRCPAVSAVVASPPVLSRLWARRMQLSAERGGGVGIFLRQRARAGIYAAATRWEVSPAAAEPGTQRWRVELVHGVGGVEGGQRGMEKAFLVEVSRETGDVRSTAVVAAGAKTSGTAGRGVA